MCPLLSAESDDRESHLGRRWGETGCREAMGNEEKERSKVAWESWPCNPALWEPTSKSLEENGTFAGLEMPTGDLASVQISSLKERLLSSHFHGNGTLFSEKAKVMRVIPTFVVVVVYSPLILICFFFFFFFFLV